MCLHPISHPKRHHIIWTFTIKNTFFLSCTLIRRQQGIVLLSCYIKPLTKTLHIGCCLHAFVWWMFMLCVSWLWWRSHNVCSWEMLHDQTMKRSYLSAHHITIVNQGMERCLNFQCAIPHDCLRSNTHDTNTLVDSPEYGVFSITHIIVQVQCKSAWRNVRS